MLLIELLREYYLPAKLGTCAEHGQQADYSLRALKRFLSRDPVIEDLTDQTFLRFLHWYSQQVRPSTVNAKRRYILSLWRFAAERKLCVSPGKIPRMPELLDPPEAWTVDELSAILRTAGCLRGLIAGLLTRFWMTSFLLAMYDTGCRVGQLRKVSPRDISIVGHWITLRAETSKTKLARVCELSEQTVEALTPIWSDERELVWPWPHTREALDKRFRKLLKDAGVSHGRKRGGLWHKARRTSGTLVEAAGGDGARHLGNTRAVFEKHYLDARIAGRSQLGLLPRPTL
jgi:integrase